MIWQREKLDLWRGSSGGLERRVFEYSGKDGGCCCWLRLARAYQTLPQLQYLVAPASSSRPQVNHFLSLWFSCIQVEEGRSYSHVWMKKGKKHVFPSAQNLWSWSFYNKEREVTNNDILSPHNWKYCQGTQMAVLGKHASTNLTSLAIYMAKANWLLKVKSKDCVLWRREKRARFCLLSVYHGKPPSTYQR